jgi:hypothetical protein
MLLLLINMSLAGVWVCLSTIRMTQIESLSSLLNVETEHSVASGLIISHSPYLKTRITPCRVLGLQFPPKFQVQVSSKPENIIDKHIAGSSVQSLSTQLTSSIYSCFHEPEP